MGRTFKYYPSTAFLPSVALGTLLTKIHLAWERGDSALPRTTGNAWERLGTPVFFRGFAVSQSRGLVVS